MGIAIGDYNHTGRPSIHVTNFTDENDLLYRNEGELGLQGRLLSLRRGAAFPALGQVGNCVRGPR